MPRFSKRALKIREVTHFVKKRFKLMLFRQLFGTDDEGEDEIDTASCLLLRRILSKRYLFRKNRYRKSTGSVFREDLIEEEAEDADLPWLNDDEFLQKY